MQRSFLTRSLDFLGRSAFGGETVLKEKPWLGGLILGSLALCALFKIEWLGIASTGLLIGCVVTDIRRYNRNHPY